MPEAYSIRNMKNNVIFLNLSKPKCEGHGKFPNICVPISKWVVFLTQSSYGDTVPCPSQNAVLS